MALASRAQNKTRPDFSQEFLSFLPRESFFPFIWNSLAIAGVDGTLKNRMKGTAAEGVLRGKTGTLDGVYNLVGYLKSSSKYEAFVILSSTKRINRKRRKPLIERAWNWQNFLGATKFK